MIGGRLAGWFRDLADAEFAVERRLRLYQSQRSPTELRKALGGLLQATRFLDYRASRQFARQLDPLPDLLAQSSNGASGLELYEYTLTRLFKVYEQSDDSAGYIGERGRHLAELYVERFKVHDHRDAKKRAAAILALQRLDQRDFLPTKDIWPSLDDVARAAYGSAVKADYRALSSRPRSREKDFDAERFAPTERME